MSTTHSSLPRRESKSPEKWSGRGLPKTKESFAGSTSICASTLYEEATITAYSGSNSEDKEEERDEHVKLEDQITNERLVRLQKIFQEAGQGEGLTMGQFADAMKRSMGVGISDQELQHLFMKVDSNCDGGVDWDEYLSYMLLEYREKDIMTAMQYEKPLAQAARPILSPHRDTISRVAFMPVLRNRQGYKIEKMDFAHGRYFSVSRDGVVNFWTNDMQHLKVTQMESRKGSVISNWVTDLVTMPNVNMIAVSSTDGCISFYDTNANKFERHLTIWGLEQAPLTMDYSFDETNINNGVLIWGDGGGNVASCILSACLCGGPFGPPAHIKGTQKRISFAALLHGKVPSVKAHVLRHLHNDWVISVRYIQSTGFFVSCCQDSETAMYTGDLEARKITSYFKLRKGVLCFDYCKNQNVIVTGGLDHMIRVWNPYVTAKAILILKGHNKAIVHLVIHQEKEQIISLAKDNAIRVFDLQDQSCVQHIPGKTTPIGNSSTISCIHFNPKTENLVLATSHLCIYEKPAAEVVIQPTSHDAGITAALYNPLFDVIVSGCQQSVVSVWSVTTGEMIIQFRNLHKRIVDGAEVPVEITSMCFDRTYRRLITGAQDGTVKVWNFNNGALLMELEKVDNKEITGIVAPPTRILVAGWNRRVVSHIDAKDVDDYVTFWPVKHTDDITGMEFMPPSIVGTCSYGADIVIWSMETGHMVCRMNINEGTHPLRIVQQSIRHGYGTRDTLKLQNSSTFGSSTRRSPVLELTLKTTNTNIGLLSQTPILNAPAITVEKRSSPEIICPSCGGVSKSDRPSASNTGKAETPLLVRSCLCHGVSRLDVPLDQLKSQSSTSATKRKKQIISPKSYRMGLRERLQQKKRRQQANMRKSGKRLAAPPVQCDEDIDLGEVLSIDKILFLKNRPICKDTATLVAGGSEGWVQAWSIHHQGIMLGQFTASKNPGEGIAALASDELNHWLFTGDSQGYIRVWDISLYCIKMDTHETHRLKRERQRVYRRFQHLSICADAFHILQPKTKHHAIPPRLSEPERTLLMPPLLSSWRGHLQSITSLDYIKNRDMILSASHDGIVRLWHFTGRYIGTFGEHKLWNLPGLFRAHSLKPVLPTDLRPVISGCSIRCMTGRIHKQWKTTVNSIIFLLKTIASMKESGKNVDNLRFPTEQDDQDDKTRAASQHKITTGYMLPSGETNTNVTSKLAPINSEEIMNRKIKSEVLGNSYKKMRRHRPMPVLPKVKHFHTQAIVFSSLPFTGLTPVKEFQPSEFVQELVNRNFSPAHLTLGESGTRRKRNRAVRWQGYSVRQRPSSKASRSTSPMDGQQSRTGSRQGSRISSRAGSRTGSRTASPRPDVRSGSPSLSSNVSIRQHRTTSSKLSLIRGAVKIIG